MSGEIRDCQLFYRSTGTSDEYNERNGVWFPCEGWVYKLYEGIWVNKGGDSKLQYNWSNPRSTTGSSIYNFYFNDSVPLIKNYQRTYLQKYPYDLPRTVRLRSTHSLWTAQIMNVIGRFQNDENFKISMLLGGGKLWEEKKKNR